MVNWKSLLKILAVGATFSLILIGCALFWALSKLPSAFDIKKQLTPKALKSAPVTTTSGATAEPTPEVSTQEPASTPTIPASKDQLLKEKTLEVLTDDFMDERRPMVNACRLMEQAQHSDFFKDPQKNASVRYFFSHLSEENRDPLSETAAPVFREIFRNQDMQKVIKLIVEAEEIKDTGAGKKAELYYHLSKAVASLNNSLPEINQVLQQSYNMHILIKAVARQPQLAGNPDTITFCEEMEKSLNSKSAIDADLAARNLQSFLSAHDISEKEVGYDPTYRADLSFSGSQLSLNDSWTAQIFAVDIKNATQKRSQ